MTTAVLVVAAVLAVVTHEWHLRRVIGCEDLPVWDVLLVGAGVRGAAVYVQREMYLEMACEVTIGVLAARIVWHWWRRRRRGRPSRALGVVRDLGHRLAVVATPASRLA